MQNATQNDPSSDVGSQLARRARSVLVDLALWAVLFGGIERPEGHPETWFTDASLSPRVIACAVARAREVPEVRALLRDRERTTADLFVALRPTFKGALKRSRRERAHSMVVDETDSLQDGSIGMLRAVELWDPYRGLQFNTFATYWVSMSARRGAQRNAHLKCPAVTSGDPEKRKAGRRVLSAPRFSLDVIPADEMTQPSAVSRLLTSALTVHADAETRIDESSFRRELAAALEKMEPRLQEIAVSHIYREETYQEIGHRLGVTRQAIGLAWLKIEAHLRKALKASLTGSRSPAMTTA